VERAIFLTVLDRLMAPGSDRFGTLVHLPEALDDIR
jgi:hypothetical protein